MVSLVEAIAVLRPDAQPLMDYQIEDDGTGARLAFWDTATLGPAPTAGAIAAVTEEQVAAFRAAQVRASAKAALTTVDDDMLATRAAMRVVMASLTETRAAFNALIDHLSDPTKPLPGKLALRTWPQVLAAARYFIDAETDPSA